MSVYRRPGPPLIEDPYIPEFFIESVAMVQRMPGGNARFTYCVERHGDGGMAIWVPVVQIVRPIALMPPRLREEYAVILTGPCPGHGHQANKASALN